MRLIQICKPHYIYVEPLFMNNTILENISVHKHLGLLLRSDGTWKDHVNYIYSKACFRLHVMRRQLKYNIDSWSLETIYTSFIRHILEYCGIIKQILG